MPPLLPRFPLSPVSDILLRSPKFTFSTCPRAPSPSDQGLSPVDPFFPFPWRRNHIQSPWTSSSSRWVLAMTSTSNPFLFQFFSVDLLCFLIEIDGSSRKDITVAAMHSCKDAISSKSILVFRRGIVVSLCVQSFFFFSEIDGFGKFLVQGLFQELIPIRWSFRSSLAFTPIEEWNKAFQKKWFRQTPFQDP